MVKYKEKLNKFSKYLDEHPLLKLGSHILTIIGLLALLFSGYKIFMNIFYPEPLSVYVDFKEYKVENINGTEYSVIEVSSDVDKTLQYISGNVTIQCKSSEGILKSEPYKLREGREFLGKNSVDLLFSPDSIVSSIIKNTKKGCSDANVFLWHYRRTENNSAILYKVEIFDFILDEKGEIIDVNKEVMLNTTNITIERDICVYCDINIKISAAKIVPISKNEMHKYSKLLEVTDVATTIEAPASFSDKFVQWEIVRLKDFKPCANVNGVECAGIFCNEMNERKLTLAQCDKIDSHISYASACDNCTTFSYACGDNICYGCEC